MNNMRLAVALLASSAAFAQFPGLSLPPSGDNQRASVVQYIGPVRVSIDYSSPKVQAANGDDRRGKIWGTLVPYGTANLGFGNGKPSPWRAGANENTVIAFSHPVMIEGKPLAAGRYGFHIIPQKDEWTLIFSKNSGSWGSFFYEESEDALRVTVKPHVHEFREYLTYEFLERKPSSAVAELQWEDLAAGWKIEAAGVNDIYFTRLQDELRTVPGFTWQGYDAAAQFCLRTDSHLKEGLDWSEASISKQFIGQPNFTTLTTKSQLLSKLGRNDDAKKTMFEALRHPTATPLQIHQAGRTLLQAGKAKEAMEVFQVNAERNGDAWPVHVGLARAYMALGEKDKALEHARKAAAQAPDDLNKKNLAAMVQALSEGKKFSND